MTGSSARVPPHDQRAEDACVGAMLLSRQAIGDCSKIVTAVDFHDPANQRIAAAVFSLWESGEPVDAVTVANWLDRRGELDAVGGAVAVIGKMGGVPSISSAARYAAIVAEMAALRRLIGLLDECSEAAYGGGVTSGELVDRLSSRLAEIGVAGFGELPSGLCTVDGFLDRPVEHRPPWVVPGLIRVGWRVMVVAAEGVGKTVLFRQIGLAVAQGVHPLHFGRCEPQRVLIVDLENPDDQIVEVCEPIRRQVLRTVGEDGYDPDRVWLWHQPGGIDLRSRRDRTLLESVVAHVRPQLLCLGPIYKAYSVSARESDELAASEVMVVFDDLRTRYGFGLLLEHHAPKAASGRARELMPYGSSVWLRWPEIGLRLSPRSGDATVMEVGRWRGDRLENGWPVEIERGSPWPWRGIWPSGTFAGDGGVVPTGWTSDASDVSEIPF